MNCTHLDTFGNICLITGVLFWLVAGFWLLSYCVERFAKRSWRRKFGKSESPAAPEAVKPVRLIRRPRPKV